MVSMEWVKWYRMPINQREPSRVDSSTGNRLNGFPMILLLQEQGDTGNPHWFPFEQKREAARASRSGREDSRFPRGNVRLRGMDTEACVRN